MKEEYGGIPLDINNKVEKIFSYLLAVKNLKDKTVRNIEEYEKVFYRGEIEKSSSYTIDYNELSDQWISLLDNKDKFYNDISKLYFKLQKNSENLELIYSNALIVGEIKGMKICHPILTTKLELKCIENKGEFILNPYNNKTNVEFEFLSGIVDEVSFNSIMGLQNKIRKLGINLLKDDETLEAIKILGCELNITSEDIILDKISRVDDLDFKDHISIYNCPMIVFRKVDTRLWNMELNAMLEGIRDGNTIPKTIQVLVDSHVENNAEDDNWSELGKDLLFPLPSNDAQEEIVKRLSENFGVVVQGPPGTGKSHSIVNLICHLLAHGKRVLVTSQTDRALKVLSNKIPEEIRALCISILGDDTKSLDELDDSVRKIIEHISVDTLELRQNIKTSRYALNKCKERKKELVSILKDIESKENEYVVYDDEKLTLKQVGNFIKENKSELNWIKDDLLNIKSKPLNSDEYAQLLTLLDEIKEEEFVNILTLEKYIEKFSLNKNLYIKVREINKLKALEETYKKDVSIWCNLNSLKYKINDINIYKSLNSAINTFNTLDKSWMKKLMENCYGSEESKDNWIMFIGRCRTYNERINSLKMDLSTHSINLVGHEDLKKFKEDFLFISKNINSKGKIGMLFKIVHGKYKYILEQCTIDHNPISTKEHVELIEKVIEKMECERSLVTYWNNNMCEFGVDRLRYSDESFKLKLQDNLKFVDIILSFDKIYMQSIKSLLGEELFNKEINWYKKDTYEHIKDGLEAIKSLEKLSTVQLDIKEFKESIPTNGFFKELHEAIDNGEVDAVKRFFDKTESLSDNLSKSKKLGILMGKLESICPQTMDFLREIYKKNGRFDLYKDFSQAFKWKKLNNYIDNLQNTSIEEIESFIREENQRESQLIEDLVAKKSWYNQILRTTEEQKRSLFTWMEAIKRIGKGTGSQAVKYRKLAQKEMENCKDVIPVWIMPINRVIENISPYGDLFDVVIVDESSQSDISALTVLMRGERAVIVGDEKQISPEAIGKDISSVENLIEEFLTDIPHSEWFDLKTSLYNTALRVFPSRLVLKEHFRCVPEIINFSNTNYYSNEISPLRCAKGNEKFKEPIKVIKIDNGERDLEKPINIKEAHEIVSTIISCCSDRRYDGMTMGVISLLGESQAEYIESLLIKNLGFEQVLKRKLICGDAYSFQGDERDIMFLSMVIATNVKFAALTKESDERRFNVAASRAKNQMWIFHSVELGDLNNKCVRHSLLSYAYNYSGSQFDKKSIMPIMNDFQKDIQKYLIDNKYEIIPSATIGKYTLDFVVNDRNDSTRKIGLMCVGGNEEDYVWDEHYRRQSCLERVGWEIHKVRNSDFYTRYQINDFLK